jgi:hypothetical protein
MQDSIHEAESHAATLAAQIRAANGDLALAFAAADEAAAQFQAAGGDLRAVLPATEEVGQGFAAGRRPSGKSIMQAFMAALVDDVCNPKAELRKRIDASIKVGVGGLVGMLLGALGLPGVAAGLLAPIAAAIAALGVRAFGEVSKEAK